MRKLKQGLFLLTTAIFMAGCASFQKTGPQSTLQRIEYPDVLSEAEYHFKRKNFKRAEDEVQRYLSSTNDVYWHGHAYLMLGELRELQGEDAGAIDAYLQVIKHGAGYHSSAAAQAMYKLSWVYERHGRYEDLLVILLDLQKNLGTGDNFARFIEIPARLGNTYYVLNQWNQALAQRERLSASVLQTYRSQSPSDDHFYRALIYKALQGLPILPHAGTPPEVVLELTQKELLDVAEIGTEKMAERATKALENQYELYFDRVRVLKKATTPMAVVQRDRAKLDELAKFIDLIEELKAARRPPEVVAHGALTMNFFKTMAEYEKRTRELTAQLEVGIQKSNRGKNPTEPLAQPPVPPKPKPLSNKKS